MKYIPDWFPGAGWKQKAKQWRHISDMFVNEPWDLVKNQIVRGFPFVIFLQVELGIKKERRSYDFFYGSNTDREIPR
jgi:hypothetical protein